MAAPTQSRADESDRPKARKAPIVKKAALITKAPVIGRPAFQDHGFVSLEGGYLFNASRSNLSFDPNDPDNLLSDLPPVKPGHNGWMFGARFGRTVGPSWDWAAGYRYNALGTKSEANEIAYASSRFAYQTFDAELGYHPTNSENLRAFAGLRVLNARERIRYAYDDQGRDKVGNFDHAVDMWGAGPRAGFEATVPLQATPFAISMAGSGSAIFTHVNHNFNYNFDKDYGFAELTGAGGPSIGSSRTVYNLEGSIALAYRPSTSVKLEVGYQAQQWWNLATNISMANSEARFDNRSSDILVHGPFAKITVALP